MCSVRCSVRTFGGKFERRHAAIDLRQAARSREGRSPGRSSMKAARPSVSGGRCQGRGGRVLSQAGLESHLL
jgi:hypothetical protein